MEYFLVSGLNYFTWPSVKGIFPCFRTQLLYVALCKRNISLFQDSNYFTWPSVKGIFPCFRTQLLYVAFCKRNISLFQDSITLHGPLQKEYFLVSGLNYFTWPSVKGIFPCFRTQLLYVAFCKRNIS